MNAVWIESSNYTKYLYCINCILFLYNATSTVTVCKYVGYFELIFCVINIGYFKNYKSTIKLTKNYNVFTRNLSA